MDDNKNLKTVAKGWTLKNIKKGFLFLGIGIVLMIVDIVIGLTGIDSGRTPFLFYIILPLVYAAALGVLGFWLIVPAFQKWQHTKNEWLAWTFLIIAILLVCTLIYFRNVSI